MHLGGDVQELLWCPPGSPSNGGIATSSRFLNLSTCSLSLLVFHCWIPIISLFLLWHDEFVHKRNSSAAAPTLSWISLAIFYLFNWLNVLFPENNNNPCTALKHAGSNPMLVLQRQLELTSFVRIWVYFKNSLLCCQILTLKQFTQARIHEKKSFWRSNLKATETPFRYGGLFISHLSEKKPWSILEDKALDKQEKWKNISISVLKTLFWQVDKECCIKNGRFHIFLYNFLHFSEKSAWYQRSKNVF